LRGCEGVEGVEGVVGDRDVGEETMPGSAWWTVVGVVDVVAAVPLAMAVESGFGSRDPLTEILFSVVLLVLVLSIAILSLKKGKE
jgi:hypothetical protein